MKLKQVAKWLCVSCLPLTLNACSQGPDPEPATHVELNLSPKNYAEAEATLAQIDTLQKVDAARAHTALLKLQPKLDELNHLVARIEPEPGRFVSFYEPQPGMIGISETGPAQGRHLLDSAKVNQLSAVELFQNLMPSSAPPEALVQAQAREVTAHLTELPKDNDSPIGQNMSCTPSKDLSLGKGTVGNVPGAEGVASSAQELTGSDGPWWAANACYKSGDFRGCYPNWGGGGYAYASAKTSFFQIAPYSGDTVYVRFQYEGSTRFTDPVFPGQWGGWWWHSDSFWDCCFICACGVRDYNRRQHRWDILNASGDAFHWTFAFKWSCGSTGSCDQSP